MNNAEKIFTLLDKLECNTSVTKILIRNGLEFKFTFDLSLENSCLEYTITDLVKFETINIGIAYNWEVDDILEMINNYLNKYDYSKRGN